MTPLQQNLLTASFIFWLFAIILEFIRAKRKPWLSSGIQLVLLFAIVYFFHRFLGYYRPLFQYMNSPLVSEGIMLTGLYLSTVLGIVGHHLFVQIKDVGERGRPRKIRWLSLLKPLIISPIIFLAIISELQNLGLSAKTLQAVVMQFLLAFQNGFFWKTVLDRLAIKTSET